MKKILINMSVSLDGFIEGPGKDIRWHRVDAEFDRRSLAILRSMDTLLFGRKTFRLFEDHWPAAGADPKLSKADREIAKRFAGMEKVVYSKTLKRAHWEGSRIERQIEAKSILGMKKRPGAKYIGLAGGAEFLSFFMEHGLVDEYQLLIHPIVLGDGQPLFPKLKNRIGLKLSGVKKMRSGIVALTYRRA
ncbi:MAG: dihydrofolate reductase family protein [bacterium]